MSSATFLDLPLSDCALEAAKHGWYVFLLIATLKEILCATDGGAGDGGRYSRLSGFSVFLPINAKRSNTDGEYASQPAAR